MLEEVALPLATVDGLVLFHIGKREHGRAAALHVHKVADDAVMPDLVPPPSLAVDPGHVDAHPFIVVSHGAEHHLHKPPPFFPGHLLPFAVDVMGFRPQLARIRLKSAGDFLGDGIDLFLGGHSFQASVQTVDLGLEVGLLVVDLVKFGLGLGLGERLIDDEPDDLIPAPADLD